MMQSSSMTHVLTVSQCPAPDWSTLTTPLSRSGTWSATGTGWARWPCQRSCSASSLGHWYWAGWRTSLVARATTPSPCWACCSPTPCQPSPPASSSTPCPGSWLASSWLGTSSAWSLWSLSWWVHHTEVSTLYLWWQPSHVALSVSHCWLLTSTTGESCLCQGRFKIKKKLLGG